MDREKRKANVFDPIARQRNNEPGNDLEEKFDADRHPAEIIDSTEPQDDGRRHKQPAEIDLFQKIDREVEEIESGGDDENKVEGDKDR